MRIDGVEQTARCFRSGRLRAIAGDEIHGRTVSPQRNGVDFLNNLFVKAGLSGWGDVFGTWKAIFQGQQVMSVEAGIDAAQLQKALDGGAGANQENQGEGDLGDHEQIARGVSSRSRSRA